MDIAKLPAWIIELSNSRVIGDFDGKRNFAKVYVPDIFNIFNIYNVM